MNRPRSATLNRSSRLLPALLLAMLSTTSCSFPVTRRDSSSDLLEESATIARNKALARIWFEEVINQRSLDAIDQNYTPDYVHHGAQGAEIRGIENARGFADSLLAASADRIAVVEQQVAERDLVVTRFTSRGTHTGTFRGVAPTGGEWVTEGISISRIEAGKIAEDWEIVHVSGL